MANPRVVGYPSDVDFPSAVKSNRFPERMPADGDARATVHGRSVRIIAEKHP